MMIAWQQQRDSTATQGHDAMNRVIADLRKLADGLEHYRDAYDRAMSGDDYSAATDHLEATKRVLAELVQTNTERLAKATGDVEIVNDLWHDAKIEALKARLD